MKGLEVEMNEFNLDEIESIELVGEDYTVDITVADTHMFFANDIYTHNSSIKSEIVESDQIGGSIKKGQIGHFIMSIAKSLEQKESGRANVAILKSRFGKDGITFMDVLFDNKTIQIDIADTASAFTFTQKKQVDVKHEQDYVNQVLSKARQRLNSDDEI